MHHTAQLELFAWSCGKIEPSYNGNPPAVCDVAGSDRAEYVSHMKAHGARTLTTEPMIKLRKSAPVAKLSAPNVPPFKMLTWTRTSTSQGMCGCGHGGWEHGPESCSQCACLLASWRVPPLVTTTERRGQYWSNGADPHSIWVITHTAPGSGIKPELVRLYVNADGTVTEDWSAAKSSRRGANRIAKRAA